MTKHPGSQAGNLTVQMFNQHPQAWFCHPGPGLSKGTCLAADLGMSEHLPLASDGGHHVRMGGTTTHIPKPTKQGCYIMMGINSSMAQGHRFLGSRTGQGQPTSRCSPCRTGRKPARSPQERSLFTPEGENPIVKSLCPQLRHSGNTESLSYSTGSLTEGCSPRPQ